MSARKLALSLLVLLLIALRVQAQAPPPTRFEHISIEQGLSQVTVYCILQDSQGFMWFGTEDGLNRYDGYTFTIYRRDPEDPATLGANTVRALYEDSSGRLWVGTDGGLDLFDRSAQRFVHYRHDPTDPRSLSHDSVTTLYEDAAGTLWIGTDGGLNRLVLSEAEGFDPVAGAFTAYRHDPDDPRSLSGDSVTAIRQDAAGVLWVATYGGLNRFDPATGHVTRYQHDPADANSLASDDVTALWLGRDGTLWVGTLGGLDALDTQAEVFTHYHHDPADPRTLDSEEVASLLEDSSGALWVGTMSALNEFDPLSGTFARHDNDARDPHSLTPGGAISLCQDAAGVLWIGSDVGGLNKLDPRTRRFVHFRHDPDDPTSLDSNIVWSIGGDSSGAIWVGTASGGLNRLVLSEAEGLDRATGQFVHYHRDPDDPHSLSSTAALVVTVDSTDTVWVGTWGGGVNRLDPEQAGRFVHYRHDPADATSLGDDVVWAIHEDAAGALWFGTFGSGLDRFDRETETFTHYRHAPSDPASLGGDVILTIAHDRAETLWVGTTQGLSRFDPATGTFHNWRNDPADPASLCSNAVSAIYEDTAGRFWIGTDDGLDRFDRATETFTHYTERDGIASDSIAGILEDEAGFLWISSFRGLSRFDPRTGEFKNYDARDGLQSNEFNRAAAFRSASGEMFFGGVNGLTAFYPAEITDNSHVPPIVLTGFRIFNAPVGIGGDSPLTRPIDETSEMVLSYQDTVFSFEFAALDYSVPERNRYAYVLEGFDRDWIVVDSARRFASYANLPAGRYTFRVCGSNNDGVWNESGTSIAVTVTPPPWKTWWAYALYALAAALVVAAVVRYRRNTVERKQAERTMWAVQEERDRIAALLESRRQLVATLAHDLRTPVAIMRGHLELAQTPEVLISPVSGEVMLQELDRLGRLLDDLFTLSRLEVAQLPLALAPVEIVALARRAVTAMGTPAWQQGKVQVVLRAAESEAWVLADEQRVLQVLMNLLHNGVRHTLPGGVVEVGVEIGAEAVVIRVRDTGEGIHSDDLPRIWERFYRGQSRAGGGAGLGLAVVKELTEAMGGRVAVESAPGEGSCFSLTLPRTARSSGVA